VDGIKITRPTKYRCKVRGIEALDLFMEQEVLFGFLEPPKALASSGVSMAAMILLNFVVSLLNNSFRSLTELSFFHPYNAAQIVQSGSLDTNAVIIPTSTFIECSAASIVIFRKRKLFV
jgi:hypothetical protein